MSLALNTFSHQLCHWSPFPSLSATHWCFSVKPRWLAHDLYVVADGNYSCINATHIDAKNIKQKSVIDAGPSTVSFLTLLFKSPIYAGNVLVYASCSAGFFAWLAGSPIILEKMGYSPQDIGFKLYSHKPSHLW